MTRLLRVLTLPAAALLLFTGCSSDDAPSKSASSPTSGSPTSGSPTSGSPAAKGDYSIGDYKAAVLAYYDEKGDAALEGAPFTIKGRAQFSCMVDAFAEVQDIEKLRSIGTPDENPSAIFTLGTGEEDKPSAAQAKKLLDGIDECSIDLRPAVISSISNGIGKSLTDKTQLKILTECVNTIPDNLMREFMVLSMIGGTPKQSKEMDDWLRSAETCLTENDYNPASTG